MVTVDDTLGSLSSPGRRPRRRVFVKSGDEPSLTMCRDLYPTPDGRPSSLGPRSSVPVRAGPLRGLFSRLGQDQDRVGCTCRRGAGCVTGKSEKEVPCPHVSGLEGPRSPTSALQGKTGTKDQGDLLFPG